jgi:Leucine-rich repeat (LRR) protein
LNLSFNLINDLTGIEELTQLRQLHLNHNRIVLIDPLENLQSIKVLSLMHN